MPDRVASELGNDSRMRRMRKGRRFHPMMFEELFHHPMFRESTDHAGLPVLMMFSMLRDDYPWLYEVGLQLYSAIESGNSKAIERARRALESIIEMTLHGPMGEMMGGPGDEEAMMFLHHLVRSMDRYIRVPKRAAKGATKSPPKGK